VIAVDTNILVYAHRAESLFHGVALRRITELAEGLAAWAIPWPCIHEFLTVVTHPRIFAHPTPAGGAIEQVDDWLRSPALVLLAESQPHWETLRKLLETGRVAGPLVHDAKIVALCLQHGVRELWSADRDFSRFPSLKVVNPLVG
jgi:toxin-antitoxin system PIN domain toxin